MTAQWRPLALERRPRRPSTVVGALDETSVVTEGTASVPDVIVSKMVKGVPIADVETARTDTLEPPKWPLVAPLVQ